VLSAALPEDCGDTATAPISGKAVKSTKGSNPRRHTLSAIYDGTEGAPNANGFVSATGTLTFTGGTGRFGGAGGSATFTAVFRRLPLGTPPFQVAAYYTIHGHVFLPDSGD
jgi:hypothetical protein